MKFHNSIAKLACLIFIYIYSNQAIGQLDFTPEEQEFIKNNPTLKLGYDHNWNPFEYNDIDNGFTGLAKEYISHISKVTGIKFETSPFENWSDVLNGLKKGELDVSASMHPVDERKAYLHFSEPYFYSESVYLFRRGENIKRSISNSENLKVGVIKDGFISKYLKENYRDINVTYYNNIELGIDALRSGDIDTYLDNRIVLHHQITKKGINDVEIGAQLKGVSGMKISIGSRKGLSPLNSIIDKALASLSPERKRFMNSKWISFSKHTKTNTVLTDIEKDWLKKHSKINCYVKGNQPYLMWDKEASGITTEVLNFIAETYNLEINYIHADSEKEVFEKLKNNTCIDFYPIFDDKPILEQNLGATNSYISSSLVVFANPKNSFTHNMEDLYGKTVAISKELGIKNKLIKAYPLIEFKEYTSRIKALKHVNTGSIEAYIGLNITGEYIIRHHQFSNVNMVAPTGIDKQQFRFALNSENWVLASILNKGISQISNEKLALFSHEYFSQANHKGLYQILTILTILSITVLGFIFWTGMLKDKVKKQSKKIKESKQQLKLQNKNLEKLVEKRTIAIKTNEQELERISKLSRNALSLTESGFWQFDFSHPKIYAPSDKILELKGLISKKDNHLLKEYYFQMLKADRQLAKQTFRAFKAAQNKSVFKATYKFKRPTDGKVIWIKSKAEIIKDSSGKRLYMYGVSQDITNTQNLLSKIAKEKQFSDNIINLIPNGLSVFNVHDGYTFLSQRTTEILGYSFEDLKHNATDDELSKIHPEDRDKFLQHVKLIRETPETRSLTLRTKHKNGKYLWIKETHLPFEFDDNGKVLSVLGVIEDITDLKEQETKINHQKELSQILTKISSQYINCPIEEVDDAVFSALKQIAQFIKADKARIYEYHGKNEKCTPLTEWTSSIVKNNSSSAFILPCTFSEEIHQNHENGEHFIIHDTCSRFDEPILNYVKENKIKSLLSVPYFRDKQLRGFIEYNFMSNTHQFLDWEINLLKVFAEVLSNISARLKTEKDIQEKHNYLKTLVQSIPGSVFAKDLSGKYTLASRQTLEFTNCKEEDFIGKTDHDLYSSDLAKTFIDNDENVFATNQASYNQEKLFDEYGDLKAVYEVAKNPVINSKGETIGLIGISRDITEIILNETEIRKNSERIEKLMQVSSYSINDISAFLNFAQERAVDITESGIGYIMMYDEDKKTFTLSNLSDGVMHDTSFSRQTMTENLDEAGLWGEVVRQRKPILVNDYSKNHPKAKGTPDNHFQIHRFLSIPVFSQGKIVAVAGVANKLKPYNETDQNQLKLLMDYVWKKYEAHQNMVNLKEAKDYLDFTLQSANMGTWTYDVPTKTISFQADCLGIFKPEGPQSRYSKDEYLKIVHPEDAKMVEEVFGSVLKNKKSKYNLAYRILKQDGEYTHISKSGEVIYNSEGIPITANGIIWDVTELKTKEKAIKRLQENLSQILNSIPIGVAIFNRKTKSPLFINDTIKEMLEIESTVDLKADDLNLYKDKNALGEAIKLLDKENKVDNREIEFVTVKNKKEFWAKTSIIRGNFLDEETSLVSLYDVTDNKELESKLRRSYDQINSATNAANIGSWDYRPLTDELYTNETFVTMLGYPSNYKVTCLDAWSTKLHPDDVDWVNSALEPHFEGNATHKYDIEFRMLHKDGHYVWIRDVGEVVEKNEEGKCQRFIGFQMDISSQKEMQLNIESAKIKAEEANKAKSTFLANMSHEIRTPMNAIIGFSEILSQQIKKPSNLNYLNSIQSSGKTLLGIINDILDISKIEAGKTEIRTEEIAIRSLVEEVASMFEIKAKDKNLRFNVSISPELPKHLELDELRLRQVLINLINNAFKFTEAGSVSILVSHEKRSTDKVDLTLKVTDTGIGISEHDLKSIFQSFQQVEDLDTRKYGGTGLGLSISKQLIALMGGSLSAESQLNQGSVFTIQLPEVTVVSNYSDVLSASCKQRLRSVEFSHAKVLVVDDIEDNRNVIIGYLQSFNLTIMEARNGQEAIEMVNQNAPDVVLMDLRMPILDGYEAAKQIKSNPKTQHTPIIALTASALNTKKEVITEGFDGFIRKPILYAQLIKSLIQFIPYTEHAEKQESKESNLIDYTIENQDNLEEIINELEQIKTEYWDSLSSRIRLKGAKTFITTLKTFNDKHQLPHLEIYLETLDNAVQIFDIKEVEELVLDFPNYILILKSKLPHSLN
ncbi:MAG: hypothetical protein BM564_12675 [Bacteroidetes bacterium MedPE-SWsnd-G2]|nr:MAG: hypothetical protein BM564_12675 [Bacteroidetes bacterium MedPE-SWsnd-G2]